MTTQAGNETDASEDVELTFKLKIAFEDTTDADPFTKVIYVDCEPRDDGDMQIIMGMMIAESFYAFSVLGVITDEGYLLAKRAHIKARGLTKLTPDALVTIALGTLNEMCDGEEPALAGGDFDPLTLFNFAIDGPAITS